MTCPTYDLLSAEVDGALAATDAEQVRSHLAACEDCRRRHAELVVLKSLVRASAPPRQASDRLAKRLSAAVAARPVRRRRMRWLAAAAVLVVLSGGALVWLRARPDGFAVQLVGDHVLNALGHEKPLEVVSSDPATVEGWFAGKLDFAVRLPTLKGATLVGGRLCSVAGLRVALVFYDYEGSRLSLFVIDERSDPSHHRHFDELRGFTVCRRCKKGVEYALVSDLPRSKAEPLLLAAL